MRHLAGHLNKVLLLGLQALGRRGNSAGDRSTTVRQLGLRLGDLRDLVRGDGVALNSTLLELLTGGKLLLVRGAHGAVWCFFAAVAVAGCAGEAAVLLLAGVTFTFVVGVCEVFCVECRSVLQCWGCEKVVEEDWKLLEWWELIGLFNLVVLASLSGTEGLFPSHEVDKRVGWPVGAVEVPKQLR